MRLLIDILTLFPEMFQGPFSASILARAQEASLVAIRVRSIRDWARDRHHVTDDTPYGGGGGMVMKAEPLVEAIEAARADEPEELGPVGPDERKVVYLTPQGRPYDQATALRLSRLRHLVLVCGHYEELDERARELAIDEEISIGDYVLTGGELPAMVVADSVVRLVPGVVKNPESILNESFSGGLLDFPHYTRPEFFRGLRVPEVLRTGHHANIVKWRRKKALERTLRVRPELLERAELTKVDLRLIGEIFQELSRGESNSEQP